MRQLRKYWLPKDFLEWGLPGDGYTSSKVSRIMEPGTSSCFRLTNLLKFGYTFLMGVMYNDASEKSEFNFTGNCETPLQCECHCVHCIFQCGYAFAPQTVYGIYNIRNSVWTKSQFRKRLI